MRLGRIDTGDGPRTIKVDDARTLDVSDVVGDVDIATALADPGLRSQLAGADLPVVESDRITWLPPIARPARILCVGFNYRAHTEEAKAIRPQAPDEPSHPTFFVRFGSTLVGHENPIVVPAASHTLDWEGEIAVIVGKAGRDIAEADARSHIAGYTAFADHTVREFQMHSSQATAGKNFDGTGAYGPVIVSADEIADPRQLQIRTSLNGETVQSSSLEHLVFGVERIISYVSSWTRLQPGDVIATGTPAGIGYRRTPPRYLTDGDELVVEIPGFVRLRNPICG